jgi:Ca-activated chloride channel homolog
VIAGRWVLHCVAIAFVTSASLLAQAPARFSSGTAAVRVDVLVTVGNRPVTGLKASDFALRDNGVPQAITDVSQEMLPLNVFCVLDLSGSVTGRPLAQLKDATASLFGTLRDRDRASLMTFADRLVLHSPLTRDTNRLRALLDGMKAGGQTSFIDAAFAALALRESDDGRALMLLFSDGEDTASWLRAQPVIEAARRSDVVIYPVTIKRPPLAARSTFSTMNLGSPFPIRETTIVRDTRDETPQKLLEALADETGGRVIFVENDEKLQEHFVRVLSEFRQRYVLSYTPSGVTTEGWHTLDVTVVGKSAQVKARRGYAGESASRGGATKER